MIVLGLDIATTTGFAWYDASPSVSLSSIKTGLIKAEGKADEDKAGSLAVQLIAELHEHVDGRRVRKPIDFVAIERPLPNVMQFEKETDDLAGGSVETTINPNQMLLHQLIGAACAILAAYKIPYVTIAPQSWRASYFGKGFKPPKKPVKDKHGNQKKNRRGELMWKNDWKTPAIEKARALRIEVRNADAAEAVGIAFAGAGHDALRMMTSDRNRAAEQAKREQEARAAA